MQETNGFIFAGLVKMPEIIQGKMNSTAQDQPAILELKRFTAIPYNYTAH